MGERVAGPVDRATADVRYLPGLDGLRALAVLAVVAYHLGFWWAPGGFLGVDLFFVISGYLITGLLAADWDRRGRINLPRFWVRRARRLLPALTVMVVLVTAVAELAARSRLSQLRGDVLAAATYTSNWWQIAQHHSYYARFTPPSLLQHLWSLAVEEQFYLLWPLILVAGLCCLSRQKLTRLVLMGALASSVAMAVLYRPGEDPSRVYFGTDTHAGGLLIGAALALAWPPARLAGEMSRRARWWLEGLGVLGLVLVVVGIRYLAALDSFTYRGGLALVTVGAAGLTAAAAHPATLVKRLFGLAPLRWLGVRSYGVYLWHWPVLVFGGAVSGEVATVGLAGKLALLALPVVLAAGSWRYIEQPIRVHGLWQSARRLARRCAIPGTVRRPAVLLPAWVSAIVVALAVAGLVAPGPSTGSATAQIARGLRAIHASTTLDLHSATPAASAGSPARAGLDLEVLSRGGLPPRSTTPPARTAVRVSAIGDSVMIAAAPALQQRIPHLVIDAAIGRQMWQVPAVVRALRQSGRLGNVVVLGIGNNGPVTGRQLKEVLHQVGPTHKLVLVNTYVPLSWEHQVNALMARTARADRRVFLVDWHDAAATHTSLLYSDGVHPMPAGALIYANLVKAAVRQAEHLTHHPRPHPH